MYEKHLHGNYPLVFVMLNAALICVSIMLKALSYLLQGICGFTVWLVNIFNYEEGSYYITILVILKYSYLMVLTAVTNVV